MAPIYRGCQKNIPVENRFSATNPYAAILFPEHIYDKRYKSNLGKNRTTEVFIMKMLMIVCPERNAEDIRELIGAYNVHSYSELHDVTGEGEKGKRFGTRVWPGKSVVIFTVVPERKKDELIEALKTCEQRLMPEESMRAFVLPVEEVI